MNITLNRFEEFDTTTVNTIRFSDDIALSEIIKTLDFTTKKENEEYGKRNPIIEQKYILKNLKTEDKIELFRYILSREDVINNSILQQVLICIRNYNNFNDEFFANENIMFKSLEEFLDFKLGLTKEIKEFNTKFTKIVYSIMKSAFKVEFNFLDNVIEIGNTFKVLLCTLDFITISATLNNSNDFNTNELFVVKDAYGYICALSDSQTIANEIMRGFKR